MNLQPSGFGNNCASESSRKRKLRSEPHGTVLEDDQKRNDKKSEGCSVGGSGGKLWDGSLHLNSSVTVPAVAFFKSGEKLPDVKWSDSLEVKGKVKLDAFEKYIQDLPRSRSRGLMVISICCKEGSSKSGIAGMKEVAKGYRKGQRVGLAQLSQGIDLYVCPRSDAIITILAKYGFFKGMAVVEDNQDSLIGCVVWRKNHAPSSSVTKKSESASSSSSKLPSHSLSDSSAQEANGKDSFCVTAQVSSTTVPSPVSVARDNNVELTQPEHTSSTTLLGANLLTVLRGPKIPISDSVSDSAIPGQSLQVEPPPTSILREKPIVEVNRYVLDLLSAHVIKKPLTTLDDDLPEYDFGSAYGISQTPALTVDRKLPAEESTRIKDSLTSRMPTVHPLQASNRRGLGNPLDAVLYLSNSELGNKVEQHATQSRTSVSIAAVRRRRNLFDDDEDMPEWCPPSMEPRHTKLVSVTMPSEVPKSAFQSFSSNPPGHLLPSPFSDAHLPFSSKPFAGVFYGPTSQERTRPGSSNDYILRDPNSLSRFHSNQVLRPPIGPFDAKVPVHPTGWRGWRP